MLQRLFHKQYANAVARHEIDPSYKMDGWIAGAYASDNAVDAVFAREEKKAHDAYAEQATNDLFTAIDKQDADAISVSIEGMKKGGKDEKTIRTNVMNHYRDLYKKAYLEEDEDTKNAIKYGMMILDLGEYSFTVEEGKKSVFDKWEEDVLKNLR